MIFKLSSFYNYHPSLFFFFLQMRKLNHPESSLKLAPTPSIWQTPDQSTSDTVKMKPRRLMDRRPPKHAGLCSWAGREALHTLCSWTAMRAKAPNWPAHRGRLSVHSLTHTFNQGAFRPQAKNGYRGACLQVLRKEGSVGLTPRCHCLNRGTWFVALERKRLHQTLQKGLFSPPLIMPQAMALRWRAEGAFKPNVIHAKGQTQIWPWGSPSCGEASSQGREVARLDFSGVCLLILPEFPCLPGNVHRRVK